tara:strand:- start:2350 stop:2523 length:174 start_codon:yes stop_codon:yes gene_type:complete
MVKKRRLRKLGLLGGPTKTPQPEPAVVEAPVVEKTTPEKTTKKKKSWFTKKEETDKE